MSWLYPGPYDSVTAGAIYSPYISADGPGGIISTTRADIVTLNSYQCNSEHLVATELTLAGQITLNADNSELVISQAPFFPIIQSGIDSIVVQGQGVAFGGKSFADMTGTPDAIGTYSYIYANVDAYINPRNGQAELAQIPDIQYAYCNDPTGNVKYSFDMVILYPTNSGAYSGFMAVEGANRGQATMCYLEDSSEANLYANTVPSVGQDGTSVPGTGSGNGFRYQQGDMIVYIGWEAGRPQSLSNAMIEDYANNAVLNSTYTWPGQGMAKELGIVPLSTVGLGITLPTCYTDSSNLSNIITGTCIDTGYFPFSNTGTYGTASNVNSFFIQYPFYPDSQYNLTIALNSGGNIGTVVPVEPNMYTVVNGYGITGNFSTQYSGCSSIVTPAQYNPAYVTIDRSTIMNGTDGNPMHTSKPQFFTQYHPVLQADENGFLRDYGCEYALTYTGIGTTPALLGQLGIRDVVSYLRYGVSSVFVNDSGFWSGYAGQTSNAVMYGFAQSGDLVRGFLWNGFNVDRQSNPVFDGCIVTQSMGTRKSDKYRFTKSGESFQHYDPNGRSASFFPFTYQTLTDPISGVTDGILAKYANYPSCRPKVYHAMSSHELFASRGSLLVTDSLGKSLTKLPNTEFFLVTGTSHAMTFSYTNVDLASPSAPPVEGVSQGVPMGSESYVHRSLYYNMKEWVASGLPTSPVSGRFPTIGQLQLDTNGGFPGAKRYFTSGSTLQRVQKNMGWPDLENIVVQDNSNGLAWNGTQYYTAPYVVFPKNINTTYPVPGNYTVMLPLTDSSGIGNDIGGIPTPEMSAPLFTSRGYNTYIQGYDTGDMVYLGSSAIPLSANASTLFTNDTRPTINALYGNTSTWYTQWIDAVDENISNGWMLSSGVFPYDRACYADRGLYQSNLLHTVYGLPIL